jgi:broad specificity phosphatase PhoE
MANQTIIYLVRHGQTTDNEASILSGHVDPNLTKKGEEQACLTKLRLKDIHLDAAYSSDLRRAIKTAEIIYGKPIPKANQILGLRERNFGSLDGKPEEHYIKGNEKKKMISHEESWVYKHVPDMESDHELSLRFIPALESVAKQNYGKTILVVAHGGAIRTALTKLQGLTHNEFPPGSFKNGGYAELIYENNKFKVVQVSAAPV